MKTIISFRIGHLRNAEYYLLIDNTISLLDDALIEKYRLGQLLNLLKEPFERFKAIFMTNQASILTPEISKVEKERNRFYIGLRQVINGMERVGTKEEIAAATVLKHIMRPFRGITRTSMVENTGELSKFIVEMNCPENLPHIETLNLAGKIERLQQLNAVFEDLVISRAEDKESAEQIGRLTKIRNETDSAYRKLTNRIFALYLIAFQDEDKEIEQELGELIDQLNMTLELLRRDLSRRKDKK